LSGDFALANPLTGEWYREFLRLLAGQAARRLYFGRAHDNCAI
jgi:hypothetical protein